MFHGKKVFALFFWINDFPKMMSNSLIQKNSEKQIVKKNICHNSEIINSLIQKNRVHFVSSSECNTLP